MIAAIYARKSTEQTGVSATGMDVTPMRTGTPRRGRSGER